MRAALAGCCAALVLSGCGRRESAGLPVSTTSTTSPTSTTPPTSTGDSLALQLPGGISIWFTASRPDSDSAGRSCVERVMEIRRDSLRVPIPLLYTGAAPVRVNDSTVAADLWLHCRPTDRYLVDLRTGRPTRVVR